MNWTTYNPASGEKIKDWSFATPETVNTAMELLTQGFNQWKSITLNERQKILSAIVQKMKADVDEMARLITLEMGKPFEQSKMEVEKSLSAAEYLCQVELPDLKDRVIENKTYKSSRIVREPLGVILSVMPWNFPLWQVVRMIFPNLLMGNTVFLKHSEITPAVGDKIAFYFKDCWTHEILRHHIFSHDLTERVIGDARIRGLSLTGSTKAGFLLSALAGQHMKKTVFELGGSDGYLVLADADLKKAAQSLAKGRLQNTGQSCIAVKRVVVQKKVQDEFLEHLKNEFETYQFGKNLGPLAHDRFKIETEEKIATLKRSGRIVFEKMSPENKAHTAYVPAQIMLFDKNPSELYSMELFCPTLAVIPCTSEEDGVEIINSTMYGLGGGVFSSNTDQALKIASRIQAGQVSVNDYIQSNVLLPFGGVKASGLGREMGLDGFFEFSQSKVYNVN